MLLEKLRETVRGINGAFILTDGTITENSLKKDLKFLTYNISYLRQAITERRSCEELLILGERYNFVVYFSQDRTIGILLDHTTNLPLLQYVVKRILEAPPSQEEVLVPSSLEDQIPYLDKPRDQILPNVPQYARQVLEFVDGARTIKEIIAKSNLPPEVVLDVILAHRRSSVLHYREKA
ncbi:MAG: hypothetical protein HXS41_02030 [Theionarchaea archaeon]|nr:hypothetical protein [Theionarchaea archaeon]MBU7001318.1 hypothetical protein [Theionarchaea archaeon]MBU7019809.1 hypothetical protein [Theionarchaea archaeon]MBU7035152.1 hypothetical protein [Theionarchaea archaeon]MBU7040767.1 hypothetical protein [Theionarchaea archaeon]